MIYTTEVPKACSAYRHDRIIDKINIDNSICRDDGREYRRYVAKW